VQKKAKLFQYDRSDGAVVRLQRELRWKTQRRRSLKGIRGAVFYGRGQSGRTQGLVDQVQGQTRTHRRSLRQSRIDRFADDLAPSDEDLLRTAAFTSMPRAHSSDQAVFRSYEDGRRDHPTASGRAGRGTAAMGMEAQSTDRPRRRSFVRRPRSPRSGPPRGIRSKPFVPVRLITPILDKAASHRLRRQLHEVAKRGGGGQDPHSAAHRHRSRSSAAAISSRDCHHTTGARENCSRRRLDRLSDL